MRGSKKKKKRKEQKQSGDIKKKRYNLAPIKIRLYVYRHYQ